MDVALKIDTRADTNTRYAVTSRTALALSQNQIAVALGVSICYYATRKRKVGQGANIKHWYWDHINCSMFQCAFQSLQISRMAGSPLMLPTVETAVRCRCIEAMRTVARMTNPRGKCCRITIVQFVAVIPCGSPQYPVPKDMQSDLQ